MPEGRLARTRAYVPPPFDGRPYQRPCGCRGEAGDHPGVVDHFSCSAHRVEADKYCEGYTGALWDPYRAAWVPFPPKQAAV